MATPRTPKGQAREVARRLAHEYPGSPKELCELDHRNAFELLTATVLSAQTTDQRVNAVTPTLFARYPGPAELAVASPTDVEDIVKSTGFYQNKTKSVIGMADALVERFDGDVPPRLEDLVTIPGVGRKTANVIRSVAFELPGLAVDTHVKRVTHRLGLTAEADAGKIERDLNAILPPKDRGPFGLRVILHGRRICVAKRPLCDRCTLEDICPSSTLPTRRSRPKT